MSENSWYLKIDPKIVSTHLNFYLLSRKYKPLAEKKCIEIDLKKNTGKQVCCKDYTET